MDNKSKDSAQYKMMIEPLNIDKMYQGASGERGPFPVFKKIDRKWLVNISKDFMPKKPKETFLQKLMNKVKVPSHTDDELFKEIYDY